jgi:HTH-type transcriptional regulator, glycine betaine synthesis regulator
MAQAQNKSAAKSPARRSPVPLSPLETGIIELFVEVSRALGHPRSAAEMYGLLFISNRPVPMEDLFERLGLSQAGASNSLKFLRNSGAVRMVYVPGSRQLHYEAVAELRTLVTRFLREQLLPNVDSGLHRLDQLAGMVKQMPPEERAKVSPRVAMLQSWAKRSRKFLPLIIKMLGE